MLTAFDVLEEMRDEIRANDIMLESMQDELKVIDSLIGIKEGAKKKYNSFKFSTWSLCGKFGRISFTYNIFKTRIES